MKRNEVRVFIESGVQELSPSVSFDSGRYTEFNSERNHVYPMAWLESISNNPDLFNSTNGFQVPMDHWKIVLHITYLDKQDSIPVQYEAIIDQADYIAQQLQIIYNTIVSGFNMVTLESVSRIPFIKKHADCLTGVVFSFILSGPDTTNLC